MRSRIPFAVLLLGFAPLVYAAEQPSLQPPRPPLPPPEAPMHVDAPKQVNVSVKVVEFQATKGVETGLSAFYARRENVKPYGRVSDGEGAISTADLTFPLDTEGAITVFLDRLRLSDGDMEVILQALVNENRAFILDRPRAMVPIQSPIPTVIETVEENPYEKPTVVGTTVVAATAFQKTGVIMTVQVPNAIDDDGNWETTDDTYFNLLLRAEVKELGEQIVVAEQELIVGANRITAPTFVSRSIDTQVWVRHGQVLVLGGLFRNRKIKSHDSVPGLAKLEDMAVGLAERVIPGNVIGSPVTSTLGNRSSEEQRRELVFFIKAEGWRPAYTVAEEQSLFTDERRDRVKPTDIIGDVIGGITSIPEGIAEGIAGPTRERKGVQSELGDDR